MKKTIKKKKLRLFVFFKGKVMRFLKKLIELQKNMAF